MSYCVFNCYSWIVIWPLCFPQYFASVISSLLAVAWIGQQVHNLFLTYLIGECLHYDLHNYAVILLFLSFFLSCSCKDLVSYVTIVTSHDHHSVCSTCRVIAFLLWTAVQMKNASHKHFFMQSGVGLYFAVSWAALRPVCRGPCRFTNCPGPWGSASDKQTGCPCSAPYVFGVLPKLGLTLVNMSLFKFFKMMYVVQPGMTKLRGRSETDLYSTAVAGLNIFVKHLSADVSLKMWL